MKHLFFGGVHPQEKKALSTGIAPFKTVTPRQVIIPLQQHIGAPCLPLVQVGDKVKRGEKIGDGEGLCVPVHASVSGTVAAVEPRPHPLLGQVLSVVIDNDYQDATVTNPIPTTPDEVLAAIREAGIVGMGGAAFPSNVKALSAMGKADTLIANGCECEPYITADDSFLRTKPQQVLEGMMILHELLQPQHTVLAVEDNKAEAIERLRTLLPDYPAIELRVLPTRYPQGSEKQLVQAVTGREVPPLQLPIAAGCAVFNVSTLAAIYRAVRLGIPLTQRIVTVTGEAVAEPQNFIVRIGTPIADLIEAAGGMNEMTERIISGGPMMGRAQSELNVPVIKSTNAILCLPKDNNGAKDNAVCIRCGKCVEVCPMHLQPLYLYRYTEGGNAVSLQRYNVADCMECGSCAFICPGKLPLVERIRQGKQLVKEAANK